MSEVINPLTGFVLPTLMTPAQVAELFKVDPKTITRWDKAGKTVSVRSLGGHRRYPSAQFAPYLAELSAAVSNIINTT